jgi:hypothetical protein
VSDETLRDLERRVKASPTDVALGHELVRGLERGGESARAVEELVRIALLGDLEARERLERLGAPRPNGWRMGHRRGVAAPERGAWRSRLHQLDRLLVLRGASDEAIYLSGGGELQAYDPRTLARLWSVPADRGLTAIGPGAAFRGVRQSLELLGAGGERQRAWPLEGLCTQVDAVGDRAVCAVQRAGASHLVSFARGSADALWTLALDLHVFQLVFVPGRIALTGVATASSGEYHVRILDATSGATLWAWSGDVFLRLVAADAFGFAGEQEQLAMLLGRSSGRPVALAAAGEPLDTQIDHGRVLVSHRSQLELCDRTSRERLWSVAPLAWRHTHLALAGEHVWAVRVFAPDEIEVRSLAREDGRRVSSHRERFTVDRQTDLQLVPLDGALVVVATNRRSLLLLRLEEG